MKSPNLKYKGFQGSVEHDLENGILYGKVLYVNDTVSYETSGGIIDLEKEFQDAVEDYIETCEELGREPDKPFKGSFNVRVGPERHKAAVLAGAEIGLNLNEFCKEAIDEKINRTQTARIIKGKVSTLLHSAFEKWSTEFDQGQTSRTSRTTFSNVSGLVSAWQNAVVTQADMEDATKH